KVAATEQRENSISAEFTSGARTLTAKTSANVPLAGGYTPWLAPGLLAAMRQHADLDIGGPLDEQALDGAGRAQKVMHGWYPNQMQESAVLQKDTTEAVASKSRG